MAYVGTVGYDSYVDAYGTDYTTSYVHNYATISTYTISMSNTYYGYSGSYERQSDSSDGRLYRSYSLLTYHGYSVFYGSHSYYSPQLAVYDFTSSTSLPQYASLGYYLTVDDNTGNSESRSSYNSGRIFGYVFVERLDYNAYQYGIGDYNKSSYYAHSEGYYYAQPGVQGMFPGSSYYYYASYAPA
jgi:hypothetical protein